MSEGWISLYRRIENHWTWKESGPFSKFQAWVDILLQVNYAPDKVLIKGKLITCGRGQSVKSLDTWAKRWHWDKSKVRRFLSLLVADNMITLETLRITTRLTVVNYDSYQDMRHADETQTKHTRHSDDTQTTPNNKNNKDNKETRDHAPVDLELSRLLYDAINSVNPDYFKNGVRKSLENWPDEFRKIREIDKRSESDIREVIALFPKDDFWSKNIKSPTALRGETKSKADKFMHILESVRKSRPIESKMRRLD